MKTLIGFAAIITLSLSLLSFVAPLQDGDWIRLFDGKTLNGWKASEHPGTFTVSDGAIVVFGERAHLFYDGPVKDHLFRNFEFKATVMTMPGANSGMYVHTAYQAEGFPSRGYEIQVNNSHTDWRRTGSVYGIRDVKVPPAKDNEWFTQSITVQGKKITVRINGEVINEYTEGENGKLIGGTVALQGHDPKSKVLYKDVMVRVLPD
jgi:hypothetical protein